VNLSPGGYLMRKARYFASYAPVNPDDLLQTALERAVVAP
jgi:hypothetical protein